MSEEKRNFKRVRWNEPVEFRFKDPFKYGGCLSKDLSLGGIRIQISEFLPLNSELSLQVRLVNHKVVDCTGRVVWVEKLPFVDRYQAGLEFSEDDSIFDSRKKINHFIESSQLK